MKRLLLTLCAVGLLICLPYPSFSGIKKHKDHDFIPKVHNLIFIVDVSDSMMQGYPETFDPMRLYKAGRALQLFNQVMPDVPLWQYDLNTAVITYGDCTAPRLPGMLGPWSRMKYEPLYTCLRKESWCPYRTAALPEALQLAGQIAAGACGRTAILIFSDGGSNGTCPQATATALKSRFGDKIVIYAVYFGNTEGGWRNLYETCKLTGGYARDWGDVHKGDLMQKFAWDITVREIMFPYPEIFFKFKSADLLPTEALKLESVANFMHAIPQYKLQIDGHNDFIGDSGPNYELAMKRAANVKKALISIYKVDPRRILVRSWGEDLPRYDNRNPETRFRNREANLYLMLPLRNWPYNEKHMHTFDVKAIGNIYNTQERDRDEEWAWPDRPAPGSVVPVKPVR